MKKTSEDSGMTASLEVYEFLAFPAHCWLKVAAWIAGGKFECGPVHEPEEDLR